MKECEIQEMVEKYCDLKGLRYHRMPDSLYRWIFSTQSKVPVHVKKQCSDYMKGVPDMIIMAPHGAYNQCLLLEIKADKGKLSQGQKNWHKGLNVCVAYGFESCKETIDNFINYIDKED